MDLREIDVSRWPHWRSGATKEEPLGDGQVLLVNGDCLEVLPTLPSEQIQMTWTDPPHGHGNMDDDLQSARVRDGVKGARVREAEAIANDKGVEFDRVMLGFLDELPRVMDRDCCCCCCCCCCCGGGPTPTFARVSQWIDQRLEFFHAVVWDKSARGNGMGWRYRRNYEFIMVAHHKAGKLRWADGDLAVPNIVRHMPVRDRIHPNQKPVDMVEDFIRWHTHAGDLVVDFFMGSGTTGVACARTGRRFIGIELDPEHCAKAIARINAELHRHPLLPAAVEVQGELFEDEQTKAEGA